MMTRTFTALLATLALTACGNHHGPDRGATSGDPTTPTTGSVTPDAGTTPAVTPTPNPIQDPAPNPTPTPTPTPTGNPDGEGAPAAETPAVATPTAVIEGPVRCSAAAETLELSGAYAGQYIDTRPLADMPADIGGGISATLAFRDGAVKQFTWSATAPIALVLVYGNEKTNAYVYEPAVGADTALLAAPDDADVEYVKLCYVVDAEPPPQ